MTAEQKKKDREFLHKLHAKHYGKKKTKAQKAKAPVDNSPSPKEGIVLATGSTRNELMLTAKQRGVKNFRVLNKQELADVLKNIGDQKTVDTIVAGAVARWKAGWGKGKTRKAQA
ncbi:MAG TPA: hypothetical protein PLV52_03945 [Candidatus Omnitrophota bacterium]|nr:hypothetical protein [Candidatus Omnitrophota bacterium]